MSLSNQLAGMFAGIADKNDIPETVRQLEEGVGVFKKLDILGDLQAHEDEVSIAGMRLHEVE